jgi:hypothetical protein
MSRIKKAPAGRKSRRRRVGESSFVGAASFNPTEEDWSGVEEASGYSLTPAVRSRITELVQEYFDWEPFERNAPFSEDVVACLRKIKKAALALELAIAGANASVPENVRQHAHSLIERFGSQLQAAQGRYLLAYRKQTSDFIAASTKAVSHLRDPDRSGAFVEGERWQRLVRELGRCLSGAGMKVGVSHGSDKSSSNRGSDFAEFLKALQGLFPKEFKRHHLSTSHAFAKEISRARAASNPPTARRGTQPPDSAGN